MKENSVVVNWNYVTLSVLVFAVLTILVLYMPGLKEIDTEMTMLKNVSMPVGSFERVSISEILTLTFLKRN